MSVKACDRSTSNMEFLKNARDIEINIIKCTINKSKKYRFFYNKLIDMSIELLNHVKKGNSIYVENQNDVMLRSQEFKLAIAESQAMLSQIEIMYFLFKDAGISIKLVENIADMINTEIMLLKGLLKADRVTIVLIQMGWLRIYID